MGIFFYSHLAFYPLPNPGKKSYMRKTSYKQEKYVFFFFLIRMYGWECRLLRIFLPLSWLGSWLKPERHVSEAKWMLCATYYDRWTWVPSLTIVYHVLHYNTLSYLTIIKGYFFFHWWKSEAQNAIQILNESQHLDMSRLQFLHFS